MLEIIDRGKHCRDSLVTLRIDIHSSSLTPLTIAFGLSFYQLAQPALC